jgi:hypothetical protein
MPGIKTNLPNLAASFDKFKGTMQRTTAQQWKNWLETEYLNVNDCVPVQVVSRLARYQIIFTDGSTADVVMTYMQRCCMNRTSIWPLVSSVRGMGYQMSR